MTAAPPTRRRSTLSSSLGLGERLFASSEERQFLDAIERGLEEVESGLLGEVQFADDMADVTGRYLLEAGGKRVRPTLVMLTAQLGGGANPATVTAARAVEITHLASLYHDDVMDEAQLRRGVPSAQSKWGNSVAILTGDLLFARASRLIASLGDRGLELQADTFERLCLGQLHETVGPRPGEDPIAHYIQVLADKTGSLIALAAVFGVIFSDAPEAYQEPVKLFGERVGVAFQLVDDVIDLSPDAGETGKIAGTDLRAGVVTMPLLYLRDAAQADAGAAALLGRIERAADADPVELAALAAALREHEVTRTVRGQKAHLEVVERDRRPGRRAPQLIPGARDVDLAIAEDPLTHRARDRLDVGGEARRERSAREPQPDQAVAQRPCVGARDLEQLRRELAQEPVGSRRRGSKLA